MASNIEQLARKFESRLEPKTAAKRGTRMNAKKIHKELDKARKEYKECSKKLSDLEAELSRVESQIQECRDGRRNSRSKMLKMNSVLQNMDLADANYAVFYDNDADDVGYLISGEEHYLNRTDEGDISLRPMKEYRKEQRASQKEDEAEADIPPSIAPASDDGEDEADNDESDDNQANDGFFSFHPNLRFID